MKKLLSLLFFITIVSAMPAQAQKVGNHFYRGADIGWLTQIEYRGKYELVDVNGKPIEAHELLKSLGCDAIRIRVWVNPKDFADGMAWCGIEDVVNKAVRANNAGMAVMIDFHYSNWWADPGKQHIPREWAAAAKGRNDSLNIVCDSVRAHTIATLQAIKDAGVTPKWIQVGNEVTNGMMHPYGTKDKPEYFARLFEAGYKACKSVFPDALAMIHIDNGYDLERTTSMLDILKRYNVDFDMLGWSLYPAMNWVTNEVDPNWQAKVDACLANADKIYEKYNRESMLVEVGMPDKDELVGRDCISYIIRNAGKHIHGLFWWEPLTTPDFHYSMGALKQYNGNQYEPNEALKAMGTVKHGER